MQTLIWSKAIKTHIVEERLSGAVISDMLGRKPGVELPVISKTEIGHWDPGGPIYTDWPRLRIDTGESKIQVFAYHADLFLDKLESLSPRLLAGYWGFKIHGNWDCLVLTPESRRAILNQKVEVMDIATSLIMEWKRNRKLS